MLAFTRSRFIRSDAPRGHWNSADNSILFTRRETSSGRAATNFATDGGGDREELELQQAIEESRAEATRANFVLPVQPPAVQSPAASLFEVNFSN